MTEAQPVEQAAHIRAVHCHPASLHRPAQLVQRQLTLFFHTCANEVGMRGKLALANPVALPAGRKRARLGLQLHQIVHKPWRYTKMSCRLTVAVALIHKRSNANTQRHRMRLSHRGSPSTAMNHPNLEL